VSQEAYRQGLDQNPANYVPLSPLTYLERAAYVYPSRLSVVYNDRQYTWAQTYERCRRLASALQLAGVKPGDTVATMLPNVPAMYEAHFGIPMSGAVLNTLNTRIDADSVAFMLKHGEAKVLFTDPEYADIVGNALELMEPAERPLVIDVADASYAGPDYRLGQQEYEDFIANGDAGFVWSMPDNEWDAISLNYTSGTTGNPKGRGLPPSRCLPERGEQYRIVGHAAARGIPVDAADVPLQWLVFPVDHGRQRRGECLPAPGGCQSYFRADPHPEGQPFLRCTDRARHADQCPGIRPRWHRSSGQRPDCRRCAARCHYRRHGAHRLQHHPCVRSDRNLRPSLGVRQASGVGQPAD